MAESFVQVAPDSTGKMLRTETSVQGANTVHAEVMALQDPVGNLIGSHLVSGGAALQTEIVDSGAVPFARASAANVLVQTGTNALMTAPPGYWSAVSFPTLNTVASAVRAAGGSLVRHVCTGASFAISEPATAVAFQGFVQILDGSTIIWQQAVSVGAGTAINGVTINITGLNLVGSFNSTMTASFNAAAGANTQESAVLMGYDVS